MHGWVKVNLDGSKSYAKPGATKGGVIRGRDGEWLWVFKMEVGLSDIFQIEAKALLMGLRIAWLKGSCRVKMESDNVLLISTIQFGLVTTNKYSEVKLIQEWSLKD